MPSRPPRICPCGHRVPSGQRCACQQSRDRARKAEADSKRPGARARGYDRAYQVAAAEFLSRHPVCTCGKPSVVVRHKISIAKRPDLKMDQRNWLPGCKSCNARDYHREKKTGSDAAPVRPAAPRSECHAGEVVECSLDPAQWPAAVRFDQRPNAVLHGPMRSWRQVREIDRPADSANCLRHIGSEPRPRDFRLLDASCPCLVERLSRLDILFNFPFQSCRHVSDELLLGETEATHRAASPAKTGRIERRDRTEVKLRFQSLISALLNRLGGGRKVFSEATGPMLAQARAIFSNPAAKFEVFQ